MNEPDPDNPCHALAEALAPLIDGTHEPFGPDATFRDWSAQVQAPGYRVFIRKSNNGKRLEVSTGPGQHDSRFATSRTWPAGTVAIDRMAGIMNPISGAKAAAVAEYVCDRILKEEALMPCIEETTRRRQQADEADERREAGLVAMEAAGARRSAHLKESFHNGPGQPGAYYEGRLEHSGSVTFTRLGSVTTDQAARIIAILAEDNQ
jgi:hypothetical protein